MVLCIYSPSGPDNVKRFGLRMRKELEKASKVINPGQYIIQLPALTFELYIHTKNHAYWHWGENNTDLFNSSEDSHCLSSISQASI